MELQSKQRPASFCFYLQQGWIRQLSKFYCDLVDAEESVDAYSRAEFVTHDWWSTVDTGTCKDRGMNNSPHWRRHELIRRRRCVTSRSMTSEERACWCGEVLTSDDTQQHQCTARHANNSAHAFSNNISLSGAAVSSVWQCRRSRSRSFGAFCIRRNSTNSTNDRRNSTQFCAYFLWNSSFTMSVSLLSFLSFS